MYDCPVVQALEEVTPVTPRVCHFFVGYSFSFITVSSKLRTDRIFEACEICRSQSGGLTTEGKSDIIVLPKGSHSSCRPKRVRCFSLLSYICQFFPRNWNIPHASDLHQDFLSNDHTFNIFQPILVCLLSTQFNCFQRRPLEALTPLSLSSVVQSTDDSSCQYKTTQLSLPAHGRICKLVIQPTILWITS